MTDQNNLVDLMDGYFRLYAPILTGLLRDFPKVHGVKTCIGRSEPLAYPTNAEGQGYSLPPFEKRAKRELAMLVEATFALQKSCPVTDGRDESQSPPCDLETSCPSTSTSMTASEASTSTVSDSARLTRSKPTFCFPSRRF
jgi:hypothetical protein